MAETYAQRVGLRRPMSHYRQRYAIGLGQALTPEALDWIKLTPGMAVQFDAPTTVQFKTVPPVPPDHRHSWELWRTRVMAFGRVGLPGRYPRCSECGEYGPRFLG